MLLMTYADQLKTLASEERVDLFDAMLKAGCDRSTYYKMMAGKLAIREATAKQIAATIKDMSAR